MVWPADANRRNRRQSSRPKVLGLNQKVSDPEQGFRNALPQTSRSPAERRGLTHRGACAERGKPVVLPEGKASRKVSPRDCG